MATKQAATPAAAPTSAASAIEVQHQIRTNAAQLQEYFSDLYAWEKSVNQKEEVRNKARAQQNATAKDTARATPPPPPRARVSVGSATAAVGAKTAKKQQTHPAAHTHDKGYNKWAKFDVDAALREADDDNGTEAEAPLSTRTPQDAATQSSSVAASTPSLSSASAPVATTAAVAAPTPANTAATATAKSREDMAREDGNAHYKRGDFVAAIKSYTRCLGFDTRNAVVLSNRAMAYLKNREFAKAEDDCDLALRIEPSHVKSLSRRATARNALGKHRLALLDLERAVALEPKNRQLQTQIAATKEQLRAAIKRAPTQTAKVLIEVVDDDVETPAPTAKTQPISHDTHMQDDAVDKENSQSGNRTATTSERPFSKRSAMPASSATTEKSSDAPVQSAVASGTPATAAVTIATRPPQPIAPKVPKKPPTTSYEFSRVWKTLALKGDSEHRARLLAARAAYLRLIPPATLRTVFKDSIESDMLCETFHVFRHATLAGNAGADVSTLQFVLAFARALADVPRFSMAVMFLSEREKEDVAWVFAHLRTAAEQLGDSDDTSNALRTLDTLKTRYEVR